MTEQGIRTYIDTPSVLPELKTKANVLGSNRPSIFMDFDYKGLVRQFNSEIILIHPGLILEGGIAQR